MRAWKLAMAALPFMAGLALHGAYAQTAAGGTSVPPSVGAFFTSSAGQTAAASGSRAHGAAPAAAAPSANDHPGITPLAFSPPVTVPVPDF